MSKSLGRSVFSLIVIGCLIVAGLIWWSYSRPKAQSEIRIGYQPIAANAPLYVGVESGMYKNAGLKIILVPFQSAIDAIYALERGNIEVLFAPPLNNIADALAKAPGSMQIIAIHGNDQEHYFEAFIVPTNSPIKTLKDFKSGTIGGFPGSFGEIMAKEIVARQGGASKVVFRTLDFGSQLGALSGGSVDMLFAYEPLVTIAVNKGLARVVQGGPITKTFFAPFPVSGVCISTAFLKKHPKDAAHYVTTHIEVMHRMEKEPDLIAKSVSTHAKMDPATAAQLHQCYFTPVGVAQREATKKVFELFLNLGIIKQVPPMETLFYVPR